MSAGLRMANSSEFDTQWIPQFGFSVNIAHGWTFKGNLAMGYLMPGITVPGGARFNLEL